MGRGHCLFVDGGLRFFDDDLEGFVFLLFRSGGQDAEKLGLMRNCACWSLCCDECNYGRSRVCVLQLKVNSE